MNVKKSLLKFVRKVCGTYNNEKMIIDIDLKIEKLFSRLDLTSSEMHRHMDFFHMDILQVLDAALKFNNNNIELFTDFPVAFQSPDHICPVGTLNDYTRHPRFIRACEALFPQKKQLSFLDCGCSAGGIVLDAVLRGHVGIGLEGSNISFLQQRAVWRLLTKNLFTCDLAKPFLLSNSADKAPYIFDVISVFEFLEHLTEKDLCTFFANIRKHMNEDSIFVASIALRPHIVNGYMLHQTVKERSWWDSFIKQNGFISHELLDRSDFARGNENPWIFYIENVHLDPNQSLLVTLKKQEQ